MSNRMKICTFNFKRNSCDVLVDWEVFEYNPTAAFKVEWDKFPPSRKDCKIWSREYFPEACRRINERMPGGPVKMLAVNGYGEVTKIDPEESYEEIKKCS